MLTKLQQQYFDLLKKDGVVPQSQEATIKAEIRKMNAADLRQAIAACDDTGEPGRRRHGRS